jgi:hypothetical protein
MVDMALLSRTVVSLGRPFADGEFIGKAALPDDLRLGLPPTTSRIDGHPGDGFMACRASA